MLTPEIIGGILICIAVVIFAPPLFTWIMNWRETWLDQRWAQTQLMSRAGGSAGTSLEPENAPDPLLLPVKGNGEIQGNGVAIGEMAANDPFQFPDLFTGLARLVLDKKIGETDAIKIAIKVAPGKGDKYAEARKRLHAAMEHEQPPKFRTTPEIEAAREALGMNRQN